MPNQEHLAILEQGVEKWNEWRENNPEIVPDLSKTNLSEANLSEANLRQADLSKTNLSEANLSQATINKYTTRHKIIGCKKGVNGIWSEYTDSAALMHLTPPGDSMQGPNPEAIIENLKRARRLHGFSLLLVGIILLIQFLGLKEIEFPWLKGLKLSPERFAWLALPISIGLLSLVNTFMAVALTGAQYINDRLSAISVGNFPWALSSYAGGIKKRKEVFHIINIREAFNWVSFFFIKSQSFITRFIMSFHPLVYIYFFWNQPLGTPPNESVMAFSPLIFYFLAGLAIMFSAWTFYLSQRFQRPILFDRQTEEMRRDNLTILSDSVKEQTKAITELVEILKPKPADQPETPDVNEDKDFTEQASGAPDNIKSNHQPKST